LQLGQDNASSALNVSESSSKQQPQEQHEILNLIRILITSFLFRVYHLHWKEATKNAPASGGTPTEAGKPN
jgi:hypothetical protein